MNRLNKVYKPYRVRCEFISNIEPPQPQQHQQPQHQQPQHQQQQPQHQQQQQKKNGIKYLPGQRLLLKLGKQAKKERKNNMKIDIDRINERMSRILREF